MRSEKNTRLYKFSDAKLIAIGNSKIAFMRRDQTEFLQFGLSESRFAALEAQIVAFSNEVTDIETRTEQSESTRTRDAKGEEVRDAIRAVLTRVALKYDEKSARYRIFGADRLSQQTDAELTITAQLVAKVGAASLSDFADQGLTIAMMENILTLNNELIALILNKKMLVGTRNIEQEDRIKCGNAIYKDIVSYCKTGQDLWVTKSAAKYNDYLIYNGE